MHRARDRIVQLFCDHFGAAPDEINDLAADGSSRTYYRLTGADRQTAIGAVGPDLRENRAFLSFSRSLRAAELNVPAIYQEDEPSGVWLAEDLGDTTLYRALEDARHESGEKFPSGIEDVFEQVLEALPRFQVLGGQVVDFSLAYPRADFDEQSIFWDLNYFKYHFLRLAEIPFDEARLEEDFRAVSEFAMDAESKHFVHRDFQSRNIMLRDGDPWFIDYQGGRRGGLQYDVASLLFSSTTAVPPTARTRLLDRYLDALKTQHSIERAQWLEHYYGFVLIRLMQSMGAYGYRGFFQRRPQFRRSVPNAAQNLRQLLEDGLPVQVPELETVFQRIVERWGEVEAETGIDGSEGKFEHSGLTVYVSSFSYKRGYPDAGPEHGGGFVFDCRAVPNPGREDTYRELSGLDRPVVAYLDRHREVQAFWGDTRSLVDAQIENYQKRGFASLSVAYGCTGGQHRSVYFAERMAEHLQDRFSGAEVRVTHRERHRWAPDGDEPGSTE